MDPETTDDADAAEPYLVWSHEHGGWWAPRRCGYTTRAYEAGRYTRDEALDICARALLGVRTLDQAPPEVPVRERDVVDTVLTWVALVAPPQGGEGEP